MGYSRCGEESEAECPEMNGGLDIGTQNMKVNYNELVQDTEPFPLHGFNAMRFWEG